MFIRNAWYLAAWSDELGAAPLARRICNQPVVLYRDRQQGAVALEDRCCHRSAPLHLGRIVDAGLQCGYHGLVFDHTGRCVEIPAQVLIPDRARIRSYPVVEKDQLVWIWMGEADRADATKIIDYPYHDDRANWPHRHTVMHIKASYLLSLDNLLDMTHAAYVHGNTVGGGDPMSFIQAKEELTSRPDGLKLTRWLLDVDPPPTYVKAVGFKGRVDRWAEFNFVAPGSVLHWAGAVNVGQGAYENGNREGGFSIRTLNVLTPETEHSCFYFWSVAHGYRQDDPEATAQVFKAVAETFLEDKVMVEAQQLRLAEFGEAGLIGVANDRTRIQMRRTVDNLLAAEAQTTGT